MILIKCYITGNPGGTIICSKLPQPHVFIESGECREEDATYEHQPKKDILGCSETCGSNSVEVNDTELNIPSTDTVYGNKVTRDISDTIFARKF